MKKQIILLATLAVWVTSVTAYAQPGFGPGPMSNHPPTMPGFGAPGAQYPAMPINAPQGPGGPLGPPVQMGPGGPMPPMEMPAGPPADATPWDNPFAGEETACWNGECGCCTHCCRTGLLWGDVQFLLWWGKGSHLPPLVTSNTDPAVVQADAGVLGGPSTVVLFGDELVGDQMQAGGRATLGLWLDSQQLTGIGTRYTHLAGDVETFADSSTGDQVLARPFFNELLGQQDALLIAFTDPNTGPVASGSIFSQYENTFVASETFGRFQLERNRKKRVDFLAGYHFYRMDNYLRINSLSTAQAFPLTGTTFSVVDRFNTENEFHGGMIGLEGSYANSRWSVNWMAKFSYGSARQQVDISGETTTTPFMGAPITGAGGLLTQPSNIGTYERWNNVFVPEFNLNLTYHVSPNLALGMGYNYMWFSSVVLSGEQIDFHVDPAQVLVPGRPAFEFDDTDYWLQGMNFSLTYNY